MQSATQPIQQRPLSARIYLAVWTAHRWMGLLLGLVIIIASITGGLLVMHQELDRIFERDRHIIVPPINAQRVALKGILLELQVQAPKEFRPLRVEPGFRPDSADKIVFIHNDRVKRWSAFIDPYSGKVLWSGDDQALLKPWLLHLHEQLHAGPVGYLILSLAAVALTLLGVSGIWLTRKRVWSVLRRPFRVERGWRIGFSDFHQWLGIVSSYFTLVLGLTGVWFSWLIVPGLFDSQESQLPPPFDFSQLAAVEPAVQATMQHFPGSELVRIIFPWDQNVPLQVRVLHREAPIWRKLSRIDFDPLTGKIMRVRDAKDGGAGEKFQSILGPLHFGTYGSAMVKWLYVGGGFAPAVLTVSGISIWLLRRRDGTKRRKSVLF